MRRSPRVFSVIALVVILVVAALPPATAMTRREKRLLRLVNDLRVHHGLVRLKPAADVCHDAHRHSWKMSRYDTLFHSTNLESVVGRAATAWGENIAKGRRVRGVFKLWKHSAPHLANLLYNRYRHVGVGVVKYHGYLWSTMIFYG
jgi:uncharacterized protein YkwD